MACIMGIIATLSPKRHLSIFVNSAYFRACGTIIFGSNGLTRVARTGIVDGRTLSIACLPLGLKKHQLRNAHSRIEYQRRFTIIDEFEGDASLEAWGDTTCRRDN